jgi:twinkle protein
VEENHNFYIATNSDPILVHNSGKSDFVDQMAIGYNRNYGWKVAYVSPENKPNKIHAGKLIAKICGQWIHTPQQINTEWFNKASDLINDNFKFIDLANGFDLESVLEKARQMVFKFGIKVLVIDPYNKVRLKESINKPITEYTNDYLIKIDEFARKSTKARGGGNQGI